MTIIRNPSWGWGDSAIKYRGKRHIWFEAYSLLRNAQKDARILEKCGYSAILSYGGLINGWQLHSTFGDYKHATPGYPDKWGKLKSKS